MTHCDHCNAEPISTPKAKVNKLGIYYSTQPENYMLFTCPHCGRHFCEKHRLPENHECKCIPEYYRNTAHVSSKCQENPIKEIITEYESRFIF